MTKNKLVWKLPGLPNADDISELLKNEVITKEEARNILFDNKPEETKKLKELTEEVRFLRDLCDKLASKSNGWTTIVKEYERYSPRYPHWYASYGNVINTINQPAFGKTFTAANTMVNASSIGMGVAGTGTLLNASNSKGLSKLN